MKAFYIITLAFCFILAGSILNSATITKFTQDANEALTSLEFSDSQDFLDAVSDTASFLTDGAKKIDFSVPNNKTKSLIDYAELLKVHATHGNREDFEETRVLLINQLNEIRDDEKLTFLSVF